jgi:hypothetical protein
MNAVEHNIGGSPKDGNAPDVTRKANLVIWAYFFGFGLGLYLFISVVNIYFRVETDKEAYLKVGAVESQELIQYKNEQDQIMRGEKGVVAGKKNISINDAMTKVLQVTQ